jgi:hypothetical protein
VRYVWQMLTIRLDAVTCFLTVFHLMNSDHFALLFNDLKAKDEHWVFRGSIVDFLVALHFETVAKFSEFHFSANLSWY